MFVVKFLCIFSFMERVNLEIIFVPVIAVLFREASDSRFGRLLKKHVLHTSMIYFKYLRTNY